MTEKCQEGFSAAAPCKVDEENQSGKVNKALDYNAATGDMKNGMFDARAKEWAKYKSFDATVVIIGDETAGSRTPSDPQQMGGHHEEHARKSQA